MGLTDGMPREQERGQEGPKARERKAAGKCNVAEAARIIGRHRSYVERRVLAGDLEEDDEKNLSIEEVTAFADQLAQQSQDPAIEHLKQAYNTQVKHNEDMFQTYHNATLQMMQLMHQTITEQGRQLSEANAAQVDVYRAHREIMLAHDERKAAAATVDAETKAKDTFIQLAKSAVETHMTGRSAVTKLQGIVEVIKGMSPEAMVKLSEALPPSAFAELASVMELLEPKAEGADDAAA
jgi:hypothetical protein